MSRVFPHRSAPWYRLCLIGIGASLTGLSAAFLALNVPFGLSSFPEKPVFYVAAALAALLIGPLLWWLFILRPNRSTLRRGILIGMLGSVAAHPLTWFLAELMVYFMGRQTWMGSVLINPPLEALVGSPIYAVFSLVYVGWLTTLIGGVMGGVFIGAQRACPGCQWVSSLS